MSMPADCSITCPKCGKQSKFTIWKSINTEVNPELYNAVRDGSVFVFKCPYCGAEAAVDYPMLYHQPEDRLMVHYLNNESDRDNLLETYRKLPLPEYTIRVVTSRRELTEKLAIFDSGLDDRVVEIIKALFLFQIEQQGGQKPSDIKMFNDDEGRHMLAFFHDDTPVSQAVITDDMYAGVRQRVEAMLSASKGDIVVDLDWAYRHMGA